MTDKTLSTTSLRLPIGLRAIGRPTITRRQAIAGATKLGVGVAAVLGGVVGFAPSAEAAVNCIPGTKVNPINCTNGAIGKCTSGVSDCFPNANFLCECYNYCYPAKAVCVCINHGDYLSGWGCCVYC